MADIDTARHRDHLEAAIETAINDLRLVAGRVESDAIDRNEADEEIRGIANELEDAVELKDFEDKLPEYPQMKRVSERPTQDDGTEYHFNCCSSPAVYEHPDGSKICEACGYDWTEELDDV